MTTDKKGLGDVIKDDDDISLRAEMRRIDSWLDDGERPTANQVRWLLSKLEWQIVLRGRAEAALSEYKANIPWESMWMYFSHGDYGPDAWQEIDEWLRTSMPQEIARTWLGVPEVQP